MPALMKQSGSKPFSVRWMSGFIMLENTFDFFIFFDYINSTVKMFC
jgi:hypothetical protein